MTYDCFSLNPSLIKSHLYTNRGGSQVPKNKAVKPEVKGIRRLDDFEVAEQHFFDVVERAEKKVLNVAANLMHDEVDILFGKDHGHPIHDVHDDPKEVQEKVVREKQSPVWHL